LFPALATLSHALTVDLQVSAPPQQTMSQPDLGITFFILIVIILPKYAFAAASDDIGATATMATLQNAFPAKALAFLGAWVVIQYTEAWDVDDGPLSGVISWWRWQFWCPPRATGAELFLIESPSHIDPARGTRKYTHKPVISHTSFITCWMSLILVGTTIRNGIFWMTNNSYVAALFGFFIVVWRSMSKLVMSTPIPTISQDSDRDIRDPKSLALNALAAHPLSSIYGIMA
jgi:hypothetical protein